MAFRPSRHNEDIAEINMIPLIDVMLVLLVIFMLAAPILTKKIPVDLPQASAQSDTAKRSTVIDVTMDAQGKVWVDGTAVALEAVGGIIKNRKAAGATQLYLNADKNVRYDILAQVMAVAQQEGITKLGFVTQGGK